jgi:hypothetical protein
MDRPLDWSPRSAVWIQPNYPPPPRSRTPFIPLQTLHRFLLDRPSHGPMRADVFQATSKQVISSSFWASIEDHYWSDPRTRIRLLTAGLAAFGMKSGHCFIIISLFSVCNLNISLTLYFKFSLNFLHNHVIQKKFLVL